MGPKVLHQLAVSRLQEIFSEVRPPELLVMADVAVDYRPRFQRDIAIVMKFRIGLELQAIAPELIKLAVEVVSPSSRRRDWIEKRREYARIGIPNYVLVELSGEQGPCVHYHKLTAGKYRLVSKACAGQLIRIDDPVVVEFDPATLVV